eukprot:GILJ01018253.1.p1 GENE.GILJ01018253.1~~GILJ01018253.1.p1  ORF type:complete len:821 (-),score=166.69 GILJ01018253.1:64-2448(-)
MAQKIPEFRTLNTNSAPAVTSADNSPLNSGRGGATNGMSTTTAGDQPPTQLTSASIRESADQALGDVNAFIKRAAGIHWTPKDIRRITEAIGSKFTVLQELESLSNALRDAQYSASKEQIKLEELRRADEGAMADGEIATEEAVIRDRLESLERLIDILFFEAHTIDSSMDSNVKKKRSNMSLFINGAAVVQCIVKEKEEVIQACEADKKKIDRCVEYEEAHNGHGEMRRRINASAEGIKVIDDKQNRLQQRLKEIHQEWVDAEQALDNLGHQRSKAIAEHVELLDSSRHAQSDFLEMCKFAETYTHNLDVTKKESRRAIEQLQLLEKILLQQQSFETYDFQASAKRLATMQRRIAFDLNRALNEHQKCAEQLLRRLDGQSKVLSEGIDVNDCEAELRRDILDPTTKKYIDKSRQLAKERQVIEQEARKLAERVMAEREQCLQKIREVLPEEDVVDDAVKIDNETMGRHEQLLDMRQELVNPPEMAILDERLRVAREKQSVLAAVLQDTTRRSRILAIRNDIGNARVGAPKVSEERDDGSADGSVVRSESKIKATIVNQNVSAISSYSATASPTGVDSFVSVKAGEVLEGGVRGYLSAAAAALAKANAVPITRGSAGRLRNAADGAEDISAIDLSAISVGGVQNAATSDRASTRTPNTEGLKSPFGAGGAPYTTTTSTRPTSTTTADDVEAPTKLSTVAALKAQMLAEEKAVEAERMARLSAAAAAAAGYQPTTFLKRESRTLLGDGSGDEVDEANRRALVIAYRANAEKGYRLRGKARAIGDVSTADPAAKED